MDMNKIIAISAILVGLGGVTAPWAYAQEAAAAHASNYMNGGIGADDQARLKDAAKDYNLHLLFSETKEGAYISNVNLKITDAHGKEAFVLPNAGPMTNVKLPAGQYRIAATYHGETKTESVNVGKEARNLSFNWRSQSN